MSKQWRIVCLHDIPKRKIEAANWFHDKWQVPVEAYIESIEECIANPDAVPQWYIVLNEGDEIIAGIGVIENDFHKRKDLTPNVCAVYVEETYRSQGIAKEMLNYVRKEAGRLGYDKLYLITDHTEFYEKCGWYFYGFVEEEDGGKARMYEASTDLTKDDFRDLKQWIEDTAEEPVEEMAGFFETRLSDYEEHMIHWKSLYEEMGRQISKDTKKILDIGCGTGLELDQIYKEHPEVDVTGIDMSAGMLEGLKEKHGDKKLTTIQADYFIEPFGEESYDAIVSFETIHHYTKDKKIELFKKMVTALKPGGYYLEVDYIADHQTMEDYLFEEAKRRRDKWNIAEETFIHFDTPLTLEHEMEALQEAGFSKVEVIAENDGTPMIRAIK